MALLIKDEVYDDGTEYFEWADGSYETYSPDGYLIDSYYLPASNAPAPHQGTGILDAISNWIGGFTGNYPNQYQRGGAYRQTGYNPVGNIPNYNRCDGIQFGGSFSAAGGGTSGGFCLSKGWIIGLSIGGVLFALGQKRGRGR